MSEVNVTISTADEFLKFATEHTGTVSDIEITPDVAGYILALNTNNRKIKRSAVSRLADIISGGRWINTGEPIIISSDGVVNDGQHRLLAVIEANASIKADIRFGVSRDAMAATNTGVPRHGHDLLSLRGEINAAALAATLRLISLWERGMIVRYTQAIDNVLLEQTLSRHPDARQAVVLMSRHHRATKQSWFAFCLWVFMQHWPIEMVEAFSHKVSNGEGYSGEPTRELYRRLESFYGKAGARVEALDKIILTFKAWNAFVENRLIGNLRISAENRTRDGFPALSLVSRNR